MIIFLRDKRVLGVFIFLGENSVPSAALRENTIADSVEAFAEVNSLENFSQESLICPKFSREFSTRMSVLCQSLSVF